MCKHILNAQVSVRAPCCRRWFDCPQCHEEAAKDHKLLKIHEIVMACKKCKKVFKKDSRVNVDETDEYCPYCDNHFVLPVLEPNGQMALEQFMDEGNNALLLNDVRMKPKFVEIDAELEALLQDQI